MACEDGPGDGAGLCQLHWVMDTLVVSVCPLEPT